MIQRIQTVYLLVVVFLSGILLYPDIASFIMGDMILDYNMWSIHNNTNQVILSTWPQIVLDFISIALCIGTIFLYKKRMLQIRLCVINIVLQLGMYILFAYYILSIKGDGEVALHLSIVIPFVDMILLYLAIRGIGADEALVRSLDRLR